MTAAPQSNQTRRNKDDHINDLSIWNGAALLVADCMGTGVSTDRASLMQTIVLHQLTFESWFL